MASGKSVVMLTTAPAGTGKSYRRCGHFLLTELLPQTSLIHLSNFPIKFDAWGESGEKRGLVAIAKERGISEETVRERIQLIPDNILEEWRDGVSGPWDYFEDKSLGGHHLAIDEIHNYCGRKTHHQIRAKWQKWLGELRHRGARIEFISQHPNKIAKEIDDEAEVRLSLVSGETERDPWFGIFNRDWFNLIAKFTGKYRPYVIEIEKRQVDGKWVESKRKPFRFDSDIFEVYDSFSAPIMGGERGEVEKEPWERYAWPRFLAWFALRNAWPLASRAAIVGGVLWLSVFGGGTKLYPWAVSWMKKFQPASKSAPASPAAADRQLEALMAANPGVVPVVAAAESDGRAGQGGPPPVPQVPVDAEELAKLSSAWRLAAVTDNAVHFINGEWWNVGDIVSDGPFAGLSVESIDMVRRAAVVGGDRVRVGAAPAERVRRWAIAELRKLGADVRATVQPGQRRSSQVNSGGAK